MKKFRSLLLMALPLFALALSGCVKYNGRESSNPVEKMTLTIDKTELSIVEGSQATINATVDKDVEVRWSVADEQIVTATPENEKGLKVTVNALVPGQTTVTASTSYKNRTYTQTCTVSVTRKGGGGGGGDDPSIPEPGETVTTYLVIGENGRYQGQPGVDIPSVFVEYAVEFTAKVGDPLPTKADVTSTVEGSKFVAWQSYEGDGALTQWTTVPNARGKILYASFAGGGGSVPPQPGPGPEPTGYVTLYFAGIGAWTDETAVNLGINNQFVVAAKQADNNYKATVSVTGSVSTVNVYLNQGGQEGKYFHPTTGTQDYNRMNSAINTGAVTVEVAEEISEAKEYTITFVDWDYAEDDWNHAWFKYTFTAGKPSSGGGDQPTPPPSTGTITLYFDGISEWTDPTDVHLAVGSTWKDAVKQPSGKYKAEFTVSEVSSISCYLSQGTTKYFHPANGTTYDRMYSTINTGSTQLEVGGEYIITWTGWLDHWEDEGNHGWFTYTFQLVA